MATTNCSIWDPTPQCKGFVQTAQSENKLANYRKRTASEKVKDIFIEEKKCDNWEPYTMHPRNPQAIAQGKGLSHAQHNIPRYNGPGTKFRFLIISAGPPGSGKTAVYEDVKKDLAVRINKSATNNAWENLGHDQNIKMDPEFQTNYKEIEHNAKVKNNMEKIEADNKNISEYAEKIRKLYQTTKSGTGIETREFKEDRAIKLATRLLGYPYDTITKEYIETTLKTPTIQNDTYLYIQICLSVYWGKNINYETTLKTPKSIEFLAAAVNIFSFNCTRYNYIIILGFPIVPHNQLATRIKDRFNTRANSTGTRLAKNLQEYALSINDIQFIDPALGCQLVDSLRSAYLTIAGIIQKCTGNRTNVIDEDQCKHIGIDYLILYDNSERIDKVQKLYDAIPISQRSYTLLSQSYRNSASNIQEPQKNTIIEILMNNLNCLERVQSSEEKSEEKNEEKKCCSSNRDDDAMPICVPLSQGSKDACGSMEFANIDKDILKLEFDDARERLMSKLSPEAVERVEQGQNLEKQRADGPSKHFQPKIGGRRKKKTRRKKRKRKRQTRRKRKKIRKTHN